VHETSLKFIPKKFNKSANLISKAIVESAKANQFDPIFLMAVIQNESSFNPKMVGSAGEIGLMQIKPSTAAWISKLYRIPYKGPKSLYNPTMNIKIGAALMHKLRNQFDAESSLYISAYNIGATRVRSMVSENITPKSYLNAVMKRYVAIYSAFKVEGTSKLRSQVAFNSVNRVIAGN
jgi:soluble lytic murein transglycosylase